VLHVLRDALPAPEDGELYISDLIGMEVVHADGRRLGEVVGAPNFGAGDLIEIKTDAGEVFLLPFTEEDFPEVDAGARRLTANPAEELLPESLQRPDLLAPDDQRPDLQRQESDDGTN
jgi:16S rRNA processing protein RimM